MKAFPGSSESSTTEVIIFVAACVKFSCFVTSNLGGIFLWKKTPPRRVLIYCFGCSANTSQEKFLPFHFRKMAENLWKERQLKNCVLCNFHCILLHSSALLWSTEKCSIACGLLGQSTTNAIFFIALITGPKTHIFFSQFCRDAFPTHRWGFKKVKPFFKNSELIKDSRTLSLTYEGNAYAISQSYICTICTYMY